MKKSGILVLFVLAILFSVISVSAQDTVEFTPITVAELFDWGAAQQNVFGYLSEVDGLVCEALEDENFGKTIDCSTEGLKNETTLYTFFFTDDEALYMVEGAVNYLGDEITMQTLYESLAANFSEIEMEAYEAGNFYDALATDSDIIACGLVPDSAYVCVIGVEETEDTYPYVSVFYAHPAFVESFDSAE